MGLYFDALLVAVLMVAPWVALAFAARARLEREDHDSDSRRTPVLWVVLFTPCLVLYAWTEVTVSLVDDAPSMVAGALVAAILVTAATAAEPAYSNGRWMASLLVVAFLWGWSATMQADRLLDRGPVTEFRTYITAKMDYHRGRRRSYSPRSRHQLVLAASGAPHATTNVYVTRELFDRVEAGGPICIGLHPGAFGWPWYEVHLCPMHWQGPPAP
jgi:hypothetical protein